MKLKQHSSLGELAIELRVNKSKLAYFFGCGLIKPISQVGKTNVFDSQKTIKTLNRINDLKKKGKKLKEIKVMLEGKS